MKNKECLVDFVQSLYGRSSRPDLGDDGQDRIHSNRSETESSVCSVDKEIEVTE
jgi:hypothetical protein